MALIGDRHSPFTYKAVLFAFSIFAALHDGLLDVCAVEVHVVFLQGLVKLPEERHTH